MGADHQCLLITVTGKDRPGITSTLSRILEDHDVVLRDVEQSVNGGNLSLSFLVEQPGERDRPVFKDLLFAAWELDVHVDFRPVLPDAAPAAESRRTYALTLLGSPISARALRAVSEVLAQHRVNIDRITRLSEGLELSCLEMTLSSGHELSIGELKALLLPVAVEGGVDLALQREGLVRRVKRLVVFDMDSTLVQGEMIDELARARGCVEQVAHITERAMQGEIDFVDSLRERVSLLEGTPVEVLDQVYRDMTLTPGARELVRVLKRLGYRLAVISGGFTFFTNRLKAELGLDYAYANTLEVIDGRLTGRVLGTIVDGQRKADLLVALTQTEGVALDQVIAIGDGANDLPMLGLAGLGVAFNAKHAVRQRADHAINRLRLDAILFLLGISEAERVALLAEV